MSLPLAGPIAEATRFQIRCRCRPCTTGRNRQTCTRMAAVVVDADDVHFDGLISGVDQPESADLIQIAAWIEDGHPVAIPDARNRFAHRGEESVCRADEGQGLDVQIARDGQSPVTLAGADANRQPLGRVAEFQVIGVEVDGLAGVDRHRDVIVSDPRVVGPPLWTPRRSGPSGL